MDACLYQTYRAFPIVVQLRSDGVAVATLISVADEHAGDQMTESDLFALVCGPPPKPVAPPSPPFRWVDGSLLGESQAGRKFRVNGHALLDTAALLAAAADHSTLALLATMTGEIFAPFNRTAARASGLTRPFYSSSDPDKITLLLGRVGFLSQGWSGTQAIVHGDRAQGVIVLGPDGKRIELPDYTDEFKKPEPTLHFGAVPVLKSGGKADISVECRRSDGSLCEEANVSLHVSCVAGFTPRQRVTMVGGRATIRVMAIGLDAGDAASVTVGWGVTPSMATASIPVT